MQFHPHVQFNGNCEEALNFYAALFCGSVEGLVLYSFAPAGAMPVPVDPSKVMHSNLVVAGVTVLTACDSPVGQYTAPRAFSLSINTPSVAENERIFNVLSADAERITMPPQATFWTQSFAMLTDRFGIPWMLNCAVPA
jgi:PhnB protein